jgi:NADPH2:quinone reductase
MKAIRIHEFGPPEVMRLEEVPDPKPTKPDQVVIQVKAVGVNPVDTYIRSGNYAIKKELPFTPGLDAAGIVLKVGPEVKTLRTGQHVYTSGSVSGAYAQQTLCPAGRVHPLPDNISFEQGAALGVPYGTAWRGIFQRGRAAAGQWILIHGASGGVGIAAVQIAAAAGMQVIATAGSEDGRQLVKQQGARHVFDHSDPAHMNKILDLTQGVHVVLEMLANVNLDQDLDIMAKGGRVVIIGSRGRIEIDPRKAMSRELDICGLMMMNATPDETKEIYTGIEKGLREGKLNPIIGKRFPLDQAPQAHHEIMESPHRGKIILLPD